MQPDTQQYSPAKFYNILCAEMLPNKQAKFTRFMKLQTHRTLYSRGVQCRYITNLLVAGDNFIRLYAIFQNNVVEQLGQWSIYTRIDDIITWEKCIVIQTGHKVFGLIYQESILKTAFMLNMEFLYLKPFDKCSLISDGNIGRFLVVKVGKYLLICISEKVIQKYKSKPTYHNNIELVTQECKWNRQSASHLPYISEIVKIRVTDFDIIDVSSVKIVDQVIYLMGETYIQPNPLNKPDPKQINMANNFTKNIYEITLRKLFEETKQNMVPVGPPCEKETIDFIPLRHAETKQVQWLWVRKESIQLETVLGMQTVAQVKEHDVVKFYGVHHHEAKHSLFIGINNVIYMFQQQQEGFKSIELFKNVNLNDFSVRDNHYAFATDNQVVLTSLISKQEKVLHKSFGRIIDFHYSKSWLVLEQKDRGNQCRLLNVKKHLPIDRRVFVTHTRKIALQKADIVKAKSFPGTRALAIRKKNMKTWTLLQESGNQYIQISTEIVWCEQTTLSKQEFIVCWGKKQVELYSKGQKLSLSSSITLQENIEGINFKNVWLFDEFLMWIGENKTEIQQFDLLTKQRTQIKLPLNEQKLLSCFVEKKLKTFKKKDKDHFILQITCCSDTFIQIYEVLARTQQFKLTHKSQNVGQGFAILYPYLDGKNYNNHRFRSITSPEHVLNFHQIPEESKKSRVTDYCVIIGFTKTYLLMVTEQQNLYMYEKRICSNHQLGFVYYRTKLPLSLIKNWKKGSSSDVFKNVGCGIWNVGNHLFLDGNFFEPQEACKTFFKMDKDVWAVLRDGKIRMVENIQQIIQGSIVSEIDTGIKKQIIGLEVGSDFYCLYGRYAIVILDKQLKTIWKPQINSEINDHKQVIITVKAFENNFAMSYYEYYEDERNKEDYQSIKFKFRIYDVTHKIKTFEKDKLSEEPVINIEFVAPDKLLLVTTSNIFVNTIKNQRTLQNVRTRSFGKRSFLTAFNYIPEIPPNQPCYMLFGGNYGGLSFHVGQWIEKDQLIDIWYESLKCQIRDVHFLHYGMVLKAFVSDEQGNVFVMNLKPNKCEKIADFNIGSKTNKVVKNNENIIACFDDGCIRSFSPLKLKDIDVAYLDLQQNMSQELPFIGGVSHLQYRLISQRRRSYKLTKKGNMIDSLLLQDFFSLSRTLQNYILENAQLSINQVRENIVSYC